VAISRHPSLTARSFSGPLPSRLVILAGWTVGAYCLTLLVWVAVPTMILGWSPMVVTSGSMQPSIRAGDVVLVEEVDHLVGAGTVIAFDDGGGPVIHRVVAVSSDGAYTTKGDANSANDSTLVSADRTIGQGRLLVPYIGLAKVTGWAWWIALLVLVGVSFPLWRKGSGLSLVPVLLALTVAGSSAALSAFTDVAENENSSIAAIDLTPPTALTATCESVGAGDVAVDLTWVPPVAGGPGGYAIYHDGPAAGSDFTFVGSTPSGTTTFTHLIPTVLVSTGTHTYLVRSAVGGWESVDSNTDAVEITQVLVYVCTEI